MGQPRRAPMQIARAALSRLQDVAVRAGPIATERVKCDAAWIQTPIRTISTLASLMQTRRNNAAPPGFPKSCKIPAVRSHDRAAVLRSWGGAGLTPAARRSTRKQEWKPGVYFRPTRALSTM